MKQQQSGHEPEDKEKNMDKMRDLAYYNGKITAIDDMMIPANDRGFYFGDGIYEAAMVFDHKIFALQDHLDRMFNSAAMLRIELPYTKEEVGALLTDLVQKLESSCQFLYWQATRGTSPRNHLFPVICMYTANRGTAYRCPMNIVSSVFLIPVSTIATSRL